MLLLNLHQSSVSCWNFLYASILYKQIITVHVFNFACFELTISWDGSKFVKFEILPQFCWVLCILRVKFCCLPHTFIYYFYSILSRSFNQHNTVYCFCILLLFKNFNLIFEQDSFSCFPPISFSHSNDR